jgi:Cu/Ag efflux protein CusF
MKIFVGRIAILIAALALIGCSSAPPAAESAAPAASGASGASGQTAIKRYPMHGKIISVNAAEKSARIEAGPIGDWMGAMTMNYTIKDDAGLAKLTAGETFDATVFVNGDDFWVGEIQPAGASAATGKP